VDEEGTSVGGTSGGARVGTATGPRGAALDLVPL
jgi:hypothetical protein